MRSAAERLVSFSILERIVGIETAPLLSHARAFAHVSVSSNGSLALRLTLPTPTARPSNAVSVSSNGSLALRRTSGETGGRRIQVSVSSNGSLALRLLPVDLETSLTVSFSILERIVGIETKACREPYPPRTVFQYPRTDRWH